MARPSSKVWPVFRVASGNFLEMYDFMIFGYYASAIGQTFFPSGSEFASLMKALMTFGAGYLMRPLGAIVLGSYMDQHGRRKGLLLTLGLTTLRKGHGWMFFFGIFLPVFWLIGAFIGPTATAEAAHAGG